MMHWRSIF